ncbi:MAG: DinB family protein [Longimicrobiales bacterium]|nr:DinB family protein [Longimicrobiales bacterium]
MSEPDPKERPQRDFIEHSRQYLRAEYLPRIRRCVDELPAEDLWWRPNPVSNSVGNLLLHLAGNARQWVVSGIGGRPDIRERDTEFAADGGAEAEDLLAHLETTLESVDEVLANLEPQRLGEPIRVQGNDVTVLEAVYHVVEHFSMHVGQIIYITKLRTGTDLRFYDVTEGVARRNW